MITRKKLRIAKANASRKQVKNKSIRKALPDNTVPPVKEDGALLAEAERRELNTPLWAVNLEREHEHEK